MASYEARSYAGAPARTTLASDITSGSTTISVTAATGWPSGGSGPFTIVINRGFGSEEKIDCSGLTGTNITVNGGAAGRGFDSTSAAAHTAGEAVEITYTARDFAEANRAVNKLLGLATAVGQIPVVDAANSVAMVQGKTSGQVLIGNGTTVASVALSGDVTVNGSGVTAIGAGKVTSSMIADGTIVAADIASDAVTTVKILDSNVTTAKINDGAITQAKHASGYRATYEGTSAPGSMVEGDIWVDQTNNYAYNYDGAASVPLGQYSRSWTFIAESTPSAAIVTFASIPATFRDLRIILTGRGNAAVVAANVLMRFNLSSSLYFLKYSGSDGTDATDQGHLTSQTEMAIGPGFPGTSSTTATAGTCEILIPNYRDTTFASRAMGRCGYASNGGGTAYQTWGSWNAFQGITQIDLSFNAWSTGFVAATVATLEGRR